MANLTTGPEDPAATAVPVVSVIMPTLNYAHYLPDAIESLQAQTFGSWECLIVDDGSTDDTSRIVESLAAADPRIRYLRREHVGVAAARNVGIAAARGTYVQFLDADDVLRPDKLELHVAASEAEPAADVVYGPAGFFDDEVPDAIRVWHRGPQPPWVTEPPADVTQTPMLSRLLDVNPLVIEAPLARTAVLRRVGGFDEALGRMEDWDLWLRCALDGARFVAVPSDAPVVLVRVHPASISHRPGPMYRAEIAVRQAIAPRLDQPADRALNEQRMAEAAQRADAVEATEATGVGEAPGARADTAPPVMAVPSATAPKRRRRPGLGPIVQIRQGYWWTSGEPLVSICIPSHQGAPWIRDTIACALAQDHPGIEVVVTDDASTDGTPDIAESIGDPRVRVLRSKQRLGMAGNWNWAIRESRGAYVKLLMQDDHLEPGCVSAMAEILDRNPDIEMVFSARTVLLDGPQTPEGLTFVAGIQGINDGLEPLHEINDGPDLFDIMSSQRFWVNRIGEPTAVLLRRRVLRETGLFNTRLRQITDLEMWLRVIVRTRVGFVRRPLATFLVHGTNTTTRNRRSGADWLDRVYLFEGLRSDPVAAPRVNIVAWRLRGRAARDGLRLAFTPGGLGIRRFLRDGFGYLWYVITPSRPSLHPPLGEPADPAAG
jgi:glycosyltransferase involved in cell wall biosynthesis